MENENKRSVLNDLEMIDDLIESKSKYRKVVQAAITQWVRDFQNGVIKIRTVEDLRTLLQIDLELQKGIRADRRIKRSQHL